MIYSQEVEMMCPVSQGVNHGAAPIPEEAKWVQSKEIKDKPTRKAHMDTMLTVMVKRASPAARRMLGMVKLEGQMNSETMLNHTITSSAMA